MVGITGYGMYIPYLRIEREILARAWERGAIKGMRSVANHDEDSITMGVEAARNCMRNAAADSTFDGLYFATTTAPYVEKSSAGIVAAACDLESGIAAFDFGGTLRGGMSAFRAALDTAGANPARSVLAVAADCRVGYLRSDQEQLFGDAAAAIAVGGTNVIAAAEAFCSVGNDLVDVWRNTGETYVNTAEARLALEEGYQKSMGQAVANLCRQGGYQESDFTKVIFTTGDLKSAANLAKKLHFSPAQLQDPLMLEVGCCGTAQPLLLLAAALEQAKPGDLLLLAAYGNGADACALRVTEEIRSYAPRRGLSHFLQYKKTLTSYAKFLSFRELLEVQKGEPFRLFPSNAAYHRDHEGIVRFHGGKCRICGEATFPMERVCRNCGAKDDFDRLPCADKTAQLFTYTIDHLAGRPDDPVVIQSVAESDDGIRFYLNMTDYALDEIQIGLKVEFTFRKIYEGAGFINYFWKCRPLRKGLD